MGHKTLDVNMQHKINTVLFEALPLCIILAKPELYEWFLNHYVNQYLFDAKKDGKYGFYNIRHIEICFYNNYNRLQEVLVFNQVESRAINNKVNIVDFIKANIDNGTYPLVFLNEWAIPHKPTYQKVYWYHESLVYGYDDEKGVVYCISFNEDMVFTDFEVDYHSFWDGFQMICKDSSNIGEYQRYIYLLKPREMECSFNMNKFLQQLENYLSGTVDLIDQYNFDLFNIPTNRDDWYYTIEKELFNRWKNLLKITKDKELLNCSGLEIVTNDSKLMMKRLESSAINQKINIVDFVKSNIDNSVYPLVFLNEWTVPQTQSYHKEHWYNEVLVNGYDDEIGVIRCSSFDEEQVFVDFDIDYHSFWDGFQLICNDPTDISEHQRYTYLITPEETNSSFDVGKLRRQLENYRSGSPVLREDWTYTFGVKLFERWIDILQNLQGGALSNYSVFHIVAEHKNLMLKRLEYIQEKFLASDELTALIGTYRLVAKGFENLRLMVLKYNYLHVKGMTKETHLSCQIDKVIAIIMENQEQEIEILTKVYHLLKSSV